MNLSFFFFLRQQQLYCETWPSGANDKESGEGGGKNVPMWSNARRGNVGGKDNKNGSTKWYACKNTLTLAHTATQPDRRQKQRQWKATAKATLSICYGPISLSLSLSFSFAHLLSRSVLSASSSAALAENRSNNNDPKKSEDSYGLSAYAQIQCDWCVRCDWQICGELRIMSKEMWADCQPDNINVDLSTAAVKMTISLARAQSVYSSKCRKQQNKKRAHITFAPTKNNTNTNKHSHTE